MLEAGALCTSHAENAEAKFLYTISIQFAMQSSWRQFHFLYVPELHGQTIIIVCGHGNSLPGWQFSLYCKIQHLLYSLIRFWHPSRLFCMGMTLEQKQA